VRCISIAFCCKAIEARGKGVSIFGLWQGEIPKATVFGRFGAKTGGLCVALVFGASVCW
jgi:hypothetical protein